MIERTHIGQFEIPVISVNYGLRYNWYAANDFRNIAANGWEVPTLSQLITLFLFINSDGYGANNDVGGKLKETGLLYWNTPNTGATNEYKFNLKANGFRSYLGGTWGDLGQIAAIWTKTQLNTTHAHYMGAFFNAIYASLTQGNLTSAAQKQSGYEIRLIKNSTNLTHGQTGVYYGNNKLKYRTICIGTQEYLADALCETRFRNGDIIPFAGANGINFTNAEWAALTTAGVCPYNNDWSNVLIAA